MAQNSAKRFREGWIITPPLGLSLGWLPVRCSLNISAGRFPEVMLSICLNHLNCVLFLSEGAIVSLTSSCWACVDAQIWERHFGHLYLTPICSLTIQSLCLLMNKTPQPFHIFIYSNNLPWNLRAKVEFSHNTEYRTKHKLRPSEKKFELLLSMWTDLPQINWMGQLFWPTSSNWILQAAWVSFPSLWLNLSRADEQRAITTYLILFF